MSVQSPPRPASDGAIRQAAATSAPPHGEAQSQSAADLGPRPQAEAGAAAGEKAAGGGERTGNGTGTGGRNGSRWNSTRSGRRAAILFPAEMQATIDQFEKDLTAQLKPTSAYERFLILEIARGSAQIAACGEQEGPDAERYQRRLESEWQAVREEAVASLARRLPRSPEATARALRRTKQGVEHLLFHLRGLHGIVQARGALDESERQHLFDLLGIAVVLRGSPQLCPAGSDAAQLAERIAGEIQKLEAAQGDLEEHDQRDQERALDGLDKSLPPDAETRNLRSDLARAQRRVRAARELLDWVRSGGAMADLLDPATGEPLPVSQAARAMKAKANAKTQAQAATQPPAPSPSPAPDQAEAQAPAQPEAPAPAPAPARPIQNPAFARVLEILARRDPQGLRLAAILREQSRTIPGAIPMADATTLADHFR